MHAGFTLDDYPARLSLRALHASLRYARPDSAVYLALFGTDGQWTVDRELLALIFDSLQAANYQRAGGSNNPRNTAPKPLPRPGQDATDTTTYVGEAVTIEEFERRMSALTEGAGRG